MPIIGLVSLGSMPEGTTFVQGIILWNDYFFVDANLFFWGDFFVDVMFR